MANVINATSTGNGGLITTGDDSGVLNIQTNETTAVSIDASQNATFTNPVNSPSAFGFKNMIINGDMRVNQRGTTTGLGAGGSDYGGPDRCGGFFGSLTTARYTASQDTSAPSSFSTSIKWQVTTSSSLSSGDGKSIGQVIEASNMTSLGWGASGASSITVSFWVKTNVTGVYTLELYRANNTISNAAITVNAADTWEFKTATFAGPTSGAVTSSTSAELYVALVVAAGSAYTRTSSTSTWGTPSSSTRVLTGQVNLFSSTSNYINMTGFQVEKGTQATSFDFRSYGTELALCQRYCLLLSNQSGTELGIGGFYGATDLRVPVFLKQSMRVTPSITAPSGAGSYSAYFNGTAINGSTLLVDGSSSISYVELQLATATSAVSGVVSLLRTNNSGTVYLSAEL